MMIVDKDGLRRRVTAQDIMTKILYVTKSQQLTDAVRENEREIEDLLAQEIENFEYKGYIEAEELGDKRLKEQEEINGELEKQIEEADKQMEKLEDEVTELCRQIKELGGALNEEQLERLK